MSASGALSASRIVTISDPENGSPTVVTLPPISTTLDTSTISRASPTSRITTVANPSDGSPSTVTLPPITNAPIGQIPTTSTSISSSMNTSAISATSTPTSSPSSGLSSGAKTGIGVGVALGVVVLTLSILLYFNFKRRRRPSFGQWRASFLKRWRRQPKQPPKLNKGLPPLPNEGNKPFPKEKSELEAELPPGKNLWNQTRLSDAIRFEMDGEPGHREMDEANMRALDRMVERNVPREAISPTNDMARDVVSPTNDTIRELFSPIDTANQEVIPSTGNTAQEDVSPINDNSSHQESRLSSEGASVKDWGSIFGKKNGKTSNLNNQSFLWQPAPEEGEGVAKASLNRL